MSEAKNRSAVLRKKSAVRDLMQEAFDRIDDPKNSVKPSPNGLSKLRLWLLMTEEYLEVTWAMLTGNGIKNECGDLAVTTAFIHQDDILHNSTTM